MVPAARSAIVQVTDVPVVVHVAPGMVAEVTVWLRLSERTALRSGSERRELTSTKASMGAPSGTSAALVESAIAASTPERIDTCNWRLLLEVRYNEGNLQSTETG